MWDCAQGWSKAEQCKEETINKETVCNQHQEWCGQSSWWVLIISCWEKINGPIDHECKPMQMVRVAQDAVNRNVTWLIVCQGHQDKKIILRNVKSEVEDATPGRGKNTKVVGLPCIWGMVLVWNISLTEKLENSRKRHRHWKLGCESNWSLPLAASRSTTKRLDGTHAWGQTFVVASKGQTKIEVEQ